MHLLLAELSARPACAGEVEEILRKLVDIASGEEGNVRYAVHRRKDDTNAFVVYEVYRDAAACDAHLASPPVRQALERFETLLSAPPRLVFCDLIAAAR
ncbi:putative Autoinducer 2-degrading protein LsrG [Mesorhizobium sp. ORS 3359]|nr:putative Autoinducer 2-degrading protein LsrG [Mesorhizobium sp. ORS 3359]